MGAIQLTKVLNKKSCGLTRVRTENMAEENSRNDSSSTTIASTVIALQFIAKSRKSAQRRDQAVVEQPAGAARGRNLRDAILKKEQVCFLLSLRCKDDDLQRI